MDRLRRQLGAGFEKSRTEPDSPLPANQRGAM
jgi:hypothetical protein